MTFEIFRIVDNFFLQNFRRRFHFNSHGTKEKRKNKKLLRSEKAYPWMTDLDLEGLRRENEKNNPKQFCLKCPLYKFLEMTKTTLKGWRIINWLKDSLFFFSKLWITFLEQSSKGSYIFFFICVNFKTVADQKKCAVLIKTSIINKNFSTQFLIQH